MEELVIIRTFTDYNDFAIAKSYLESFDVECFGQDEIYSKGGVKLQVRSEQVDEAIKLLFDGGYLKKEDFEPSVEMKFVEKILNYFRRKDNKTDENQWIWKNL